jgi:hypothetical protein
MGTAAAIGGAIAGVGSIVGGILNYSAQRAATREAKRQFNAAMAEQRANSARARGDISSAVPQSLADIQQGFGQGIGTLSAQQEALRNLYSQSIGTGTQAEQRLADIVLRGDMSGFQQGPQYQFLQQQGELGLRRAAAQSGGMGGGAAYKGFMRFNQGLADQSYNQYLDRVGALADYGAQARGQFAQLGNANATNLAQMQATQGQAMAGIRTNAATGLANASLGASSPYLQALGMQLAHAGPINQANALSGMVQNLGNIGMQVAGQYQQNQMYDKLLSMYQPQGANPALSLTAGIPNNGVVR